MSKNYTLTFKSLRANTTYVLNIGGGTGGAVALKPGAQPFTTEEDADEDQFKPIRTQTGYFRIVDDGKDAGGNAFDWKDLIPATDTSRPVTLTVNGTVLWTGFMQAQNFGGTLYGNPQEREFPVQCILSVLGTYKASTGESGMKNFAWLLKWLLVDNLPLDQQPQTFIIQGGSDARQWLLKRFDWMNFMQTVEDGDIEPRYSHYDILEDMCKFWGWTIRTHRRTVYMTMTDDTAERGTTLTLDQTTLGQIASGSTTAGTVSTGGMSVLTVPNAFASVSNETYQNQGPSKATVKADINKNETVIQFAPGSVRKLMEPSGGQWTWVQSPGKDLVGYFESATIGSFDVNTLKGTSLNTKGGFSRRQVFTSAEEDKPTECDMFLFNHLYNGYTIPVSIETKKAMSFAGGSLKLEGQVYFDDRLCDWHDMPRIYMRLGIGMDKDHARWWYMDDVIDPSTTLSYGWSTSGSRKIFRAPADNGTIKSTMALVFDAGYFTAGITQLSYDRIPVPDEADLFGMIFVDFLGFGDKEEACQVFQIANFTIKFSRDTIDIPQQINHTARQREKKEERVTSKEYTAENASRTTDEWNADCIFASDNNMEYGYGLLTNANGTFMQTAPYNAGSSPEHPEQHLANRVASYWQRSRRRMKADLQSQATINNVTILNAITPGVLLSLDGSTCHPLAISHDWRDDVTTVTMLEMP